MAETRVEVHKFGGTSVGSAERMRRAGALIAAARQRGAICVVSSAMGGLTDQLVELSQGRSVSDARRDELVASIRQRHLDTLDALGGDPSGAVAHRVHALIEELAALSRGLGHVQRPPEAITDRLTAMGEKLAVTLLAEAIRDAGVEARAMEADTFLETDATYGEARPNSYSDDRRTAAALRPLLDAGVVPVVTGFIGVGPDGDTRLLGRGGSDLSGAILAASLDADELVIWTDVEGVHSTDPGLAPESTPMGHLHYREAGEMAYFGSKVLHPRTLIPVAHKRIPVSVRCTMRPDGGYTRIDGTLDGQSARDIGVSVMRRMALVSVEGDGLAGAAGVAARLFSGLAEAGVSVVMISQGSSESSICVGVQESDVERAEAALRQAFRLEIAHGEVGDIVTRRGVAAVTAVGLGMRRSVGAASRMTAAMARSGTNILAIAQGSSECSVSFAIDADDLRRGVRSLHDAVRGLGSAPTTDPALGVVVAGVGLIGGRLAHEIALRTDHRLFGLADSSGFIYDKAGLDAESVEAILRAKSAGRRLNEIDGGASGDARALLDRLREDGAPNPVLADCTAASSMTDVVAHALGAGIDAVLANKEPLACDAAAYASLLETALIRGTTLLGEATVGAGLPVAQTIDTIVRSGDRITRVVGALSGTIAFLLGAITDGEALSAAVARAVKLGFAEPDPTADLMGHDLRRKAIILGRLTGLRTDGDATAEPFAAPPASDSWKGTREADFDAAGRAIIDRLDQAKARGCALRYLARVDAKAMTVGFHEADEHDPFFTLAPSQSRIAIFTELQGDEPVIVSGAGAGPGPTVAGLLADLGRLARARAMRGGVA